MFAFLNQVMEERRAILQLETTPAKPATSMNISKKYLKVLQLSFEVKYMSGDIKTDKKRKKIKATRERMNTLLTDSTDPKFDDVIALAAAYCNIGSEYVYSAEPYDIEIIKNAFTYLITSLSLIRKKQLDHKAILIFIDILNKLSLFSLKFNQEEYTDIFLDFALAVYFQYTLEDNYPDPIHIASLVGIKEKESNPRIILNTLHHTTLQYLGRQYLTKSEDKHEFVMYLYNMLNTRLSDMVSGKTKFDEKCLDVALTLFDLSRYFLANGRFAEAKRHIAIADCVIRKFAKKTIKDRLKTAGKKGTDRFLLPKEYVYARAVTAKSWGSYGVSLLRFWMEKFSQNKENKSSEIQDLTSNLEIKSEQPNLMYSDLQKELEKKSFEIQDLMPKLEIKSEQPNFMFPDLEKKLECTTIEITETCILNRVDAKSVFANTLEQLQTAKEYFTPDTDIVSYAQITLEISDAYKYYAGFEEQRDNRIKLHKVRVKHLEDSRKKFRTTIEDDRELQIYKRISYEMVNSCSTVMDLMVEETYYNKSFKELSIKADQYMKIIAENVNFYLK